MTSLFFEKVIFYELKIDCDFSFVFKITSRIKENRISPNLKKKKKKMLFHAGSKK